MEEPARGIQRRPLAGRDCLAGSGAECTPDLAGTALPNLVHAALTIQSSVADAARTAFAGCKLIFMAHDSANALAQASSSYLRSAMHQPIHWHEWGPEPFEKAKQQNKPVLLDIGAVWCHWCHVMDRESYENPEVAAIINEHFIAIKVDRDERPDVDSRYQTAVSAISGQGGWPLTGFLTPDGKPFYGGTYFPPDDQWGRPGFKRVLLAIAGAYREKRADVTEQASMVGNMLAQSEAFAAPAAEFSPRVIDGIVAAAVKMFDPQHGGFGNAPKFPHPSVIDLLIERYARSGSDELKNIFAT